MNKKKIRTADNPQQANNHKIIAQTQREFISSGTSKLSAQ
jgi:hypothetical protein